MYESKDRNRGLRTLLGHPMSLWEYTLWGLFGGFAVDGLELWRAVKRNRGIMPPRYCRRGTLVTEIVRLAVGAGLATAFGASHQISGELGALIVGAGAPIILERLLAQLPDELGDRGE